MNFEGSTPAKRWRREGADRLRNLYMPEAVRDLWTRGDITQAQALNRDFWTSDLCKNLIDEMKGELVLGQIVLSERVR